MALQTKTYTVGSYAWGSSSNAYVLELVLTEESTSIPGNYSLISYILRLKSGDNNRFEWDVTASLKLNGTTVASKTDGRYLDYNSTWTLLQGSCTVAHNGDGALNMPFVAAIDVPAGNQWAPPDLTISGNMALTTIPRASSLSASNGTLGTAQTLTVDRKSSGFTHTITYACGGTSGTVCTKSSSTSIGWTPPLSLANQNTTGTSVSITLTIETFNGSTSVGKSTKTITCAIPASVAPTCSLSLSDATGYLSVFGAYIRSMSRLRVIVSAGTSYGSPIAAYSTTANGATYSAADFTTGVLNSAGTMTVNARVTDKRGRSGSASQSISVLDYAAPKITALNVHRCDEDGTSNDQGEYVKVDFTALITSLNNKNTRAYTLKYKKTTESTYTTVSLSDYNDSYNPSGSYIFAADTSASYNVVVTAADYFTSTEASTTASTAYSLMHWNKSGRGIAFGKNSEADNFDVDMPALFRKEIASYGALDINGIAKLYGGIKIHDWRDKTLTPGMFGTQTLIPYFHQGGTGYWKAILDIHGWSGASYDTTQLAFPADTALDRNLKFRCGNNETWSPWYTLLDSVNYNSYIGVLSGLRYAGNFSFFKNITDANNDTNRSSWMGNDSTNNFYIRNVVGTNMYFGVNNSWQLWLANDRLTPYGDNVLYLGDNYDRWKAVYSVTGSIQTSDRNQKTDIKPIEQKYEDLFDKLQPVTFKLAGGEHDRVHVGFIAQDVKAAMDELNIDATEFAAYCRDKKIERVEVEDPETGEKSIQEVEVLDDNGEPVYLYALRYSEFIALNTFKIQKLQGEISELKDENEKLKARLKKIEAMLGVEESEV